MEIFNLLSIDSHSLLHIFFDFIFEKISMIVKAIFIIVFYFCDSIFHLLNLSNLLKFVIRPIKKNLKWVYFILPNQNLKL